MQVVVPPPPSVPKETPKIHYGNFQHRFFVPMIHFARYQHFATKMNRLLPSAVKYFNFLIMEFPLHSSLVEMQFYFFFFFFSFWVWKGKWKPYACFDLNAWPEVQNIEYEILKYLLGGLKCFQTSPVDGIFQKYLHGRCLLKCIQPKRIRGQIHIHRDCCNWATKDRCICFQTCRNCFVFWMVTGNGR